MTDKPTRNVYLNDLVRRPKSKPRPVASEPALTMTATEVQIRNEAANVAFDERLHADMASLCEGIAEAYERILVEAGLMPPRTTAPAPSESETALHRAVLATRRED